MQRFMLRQKFGGGC